MPHIHVHTLLQQRWPECEMSCKGWVGCTEVLWPHDASALSPNLSVLCGTSDGNSKRDVCFGARNLSPLSLGGYKKRVGREGGVGSSLCLPSSLSFISPIAISACQ